MPHKRMRRLGTAFLGVAFLMLICGLTILEARLRGLVFIAYWCGCFFVVGLAAFMALLDLILTRREAREAQREIFEESFRGVSLKGDRPARSQETTSPPK